jgi:hypothetical protein
MKFVLVKSENCIDAGSVDLTAMNSEEYASHMNSEDNLADIFGDCLVFDLEKARDWQKIKGTGSQVRFYNRAGKNAEIYLKYN